MAGINVIDGLTTGTIVGVGAYDVLMRAVKEHLKGEFDAGRIRATDYANAYIEATSAVLANATQFTMTQSRLEAELALLKVQTDTASYNLLEILPLEKVKVEVANRLAEAQILGIVKDNEMKTFQMEFMLPKELLLKEAELAIAAKELLVKDAQIALSEKEVLLKQNQIELGTKELLIKQAQLAIAEKEVLIKAEQLLITKYELLNKLPADVALINAQTTLYTQKGVTEKAQVDGTVIKVGSVLDLNNKLLEEQTKVFLRNAQQSMAKLMIDTWSVRHTADPDGNLDNTENLLKDINIGKAIKAMADGLDVTLPVPA